MLLIIIALLFVSSVLMRGVAKGAVKLSARMLEDLKEARREKWEREKQIIEIAHNNYLRGRADEAMEIRRDYDLKERKISVELTKDDKKRREEATDKTIAHVKKFLAEKFSKIRSGDKGYVEIRLIIERNDGDDNRI